MKTITTFALSAVLAMGTLIANAQTTTRGPLTPAQKAHRQEMMKKVADELGLSKGQRNQFKGIHEQTRAKMKALRASNQSIEAKKSEAKELRMKARNEMLRILTPAQRAKFAAMRAQWKANHAGGKR